MKRIVVGTDGSDSSMVAVRRAAELAAATGAELHVASVTLASAAMSGMAGMGGWALPEDWNERCGAEAAAAVTRAVTEAASTGVPAEGRVLDGEASAQLLGLCEELDADLLVVGNRGMAGAARFLLGSVPNRCAHHAPCSVLIVKSV